MRFVALRVPILLTAIVLLLACDNDGTRPCDEEPPWVLRDDQMNFAVLLVGYESYAFQGAAVSHYDLCSGCDVDSLPLKIESTRYGDVAFFAFIYTETGDTVFHAYSVYNGQGTILYPGSFLDPHEFRMCDGALELPAEVEYLGGRGFHSEEEHLARAGRAWDSVSQLDMVCAFSEQPYRVGIFFYAPSTALFDPSVAQWVIFLYRGDVAH